MNEGSRIGVAAQALGVSVDTLRRWERDGRITFQRRGNRRVLAPEELGPRPARARHELPLQRPQPPRRRHRRCPARRRDGADRPRCGPYRVVSLMSREADELDLKPRPNRDARREVVVERT